MMKNKETKKDSSMPTASEKAIWALYHWGAIFVPIGIMLSHWYIFYVFSQNNYELMHYSPANEVCIAWIYTILYLIVPAILVPSSYLFRWCNLFRVPFIYFIFINVERIYYGSWFCTNEMVNTHYILIYCIICIYGLELIGLCLKHLKSINRSIRLFMIHLQRKTKRMFASSPSCDKMCDDIIDQIEKEPI